MNTPWEIWLALLTVWQEHNERFFAGLIKEIHECEAYLPRMIAQFWRR